MLQEAGVEVLSWCGHTDKSLVNPESGQQPLFRHRVVHYLTLHSGRNFSPTATAAVGHQKQERDMLGGWSSQGSERCTRLANQRISAMQITDARTFQDASCADPLCEAESRQCLVAFMREAGVP